MNKIAELRNKAGLTQKQLAENTGTNIRWIQKIERGEINIQHITFLKAVRLIRALAHAEAIDMEESDEAIKSYAVIEALLTDKSHSLIRTVPELRKQAGMTQKELADKMDTNTRWIQKVEHGEISVRNISLIKAVSLIKAFSEVESLDNETWADAKSFYLTTRRLLEQS